MSARPTLALSRIYAWCTTVANRVLPGSEWRGRGFSATLEDPVPDGVHNYLFGAPSDWLLWLQNWAGSYTGNNVIYLPLGSAAWTTRYSGADALTQFRMRTGASPESEPGAYVQIESLTAAAGDGRYVTCLPYGGLPGPTDAVLYVTAVNGTYDAIVRLYDSGSTGTAIYREFEITGSSATGAVNIPLIAGSPTELAGPVGLEVIVMPSASGGYARVQGLKIYFGTLDPSA